MNHVVRHLSSTLPALIRHGAAQKPALAAAHRLEWRRGIRVEVRYGNLEHALSVMERKMRSSGMERLIKRQVDHHVKNSEKRVLARKNLEMRVRSQELARKLRTILVKKLRGQ